MGLSLETLQESSSGFKELDSGGDTGFKIQDYVAKVALRPAAGSDAAQSLELKLQYSDEESDETYVGLTLDDFRADPLRRYRGSQVDELNVEHWTYQATHRIDFTDRLDLTTIAYHTETERAWYKLNDVRNAADTGYTSLSAILEDPATYATEFAAIVGEPGTSSAVGALQGAQQQSRVLRDRRADGARLLVRGLGRRAPARGLGPLPRGRGGPLPERRPLPDGRRADAR